MEKKGQTMNATHIPQDIQGKKPNILLSIFLLILLTIVVIGLVIFFVFRVTLKSNEQLIQIGASQEISYVVF